VCVQDASDQAPAKRYMQLAGACQYTHALTSAEDQVCPIRAAATSQGRAGGQNSSSGSKHTLPATAQVDGVRV
jgi:hypothetical protein